MEPPQEPSVEDCCNSGCNPCIFDVYERKLRLYKNFDKISETPDLRKENGISELMYTTFKIVSTTLLCTSQKILKLKRSILDHADVWWSPGDHFLFKYTNENVTCTRAYTPIKLSTHKNEDYDFLIVIKNYDNGLVSKHLFNLKVEDLTLWRGPYGSYKIKPNTYKRIVMIAQGTGIAPFISIIESILNNEDDMTMLVLKYCCQSADNILFRDELYLFHSYWNFSYEIFLSAIQCDTNFRYQEPITIRRFSYEDLSNLKPSSNDQFLICGSTKFMKDYSDFLNKEFGVSENLMLF